MVNLTFSSRDLQARLADAGALQAAARALLAARPLGLGVARQVRGRRVARLVAACSGVAARATGLALRCCVHAGCLAVTERRLAACPRH